MPAVMPQSFARTLPGRPVCATRTPHYCGNTPRLVLIWLNLPASSVSSLYC